MIFTGHTLENFKEIIDSNERFVVISHVNPDGDTIGAALGWHNLLDNMGKKATAVTPNDCPDSLKWMGGAGQMLVFSNSKEAVQQAFDQAQVLICLDFNSSDRVDEAKPLIDAFQGKKLAIDHHPNPRDFVDVMISAPEASSTCEISYWLICALGYRHFMTMQVAEALYTGIITDTGSLSHNSSRPETYQAIADMLTCGIDKVSIHDHIFSNYTEGRLRLFGDIISRNLRVLYEHKVAYMFITEAQQKYFGFNPGDSEGFVNSPLSIKGIKFCAMFTQMPDQIKVSLRSKGDFPANKFAAQYFNGGGHLNAAGGRIQCKLFEAMHLFEEGVKEYKQYLD